HPGKMQQPAIAAAPTHQAFQALCLPFIVNLLLVELLGSQMIPALAAPLLCLGFAMPDRAR
ncbi:MAG TPA: hypothetical protein VFL42_02090, partial [Terriglobales bacterium]|nr:hypothetical protein [Terriglobales bacterium]